MVSTTFKAKNVEIYVANIDTPASFLPGSKGNDVTLAAYVDTALNTSSVISNLVKISDKKNELSVEPAEDDAETRLFYGADSNGNQNSGTETTENNDVDITISADAEFEDTIEALGLDADTDTHSEVSDYKSYNLASRTTDQLLVFVRVARLISGTYYYKNYCIVNPVFKKLGDITGASDDAALSTEYTLLGNKSDTYFDTYNDDTSEILVGTGW